MLCAEKLAKYKRSESNPPFNPLLIEAEIPIGTYKIINK